MTALEKYALKQAESTLAGAQNALVALHSDYGSGKSNAVLFASKISDIRQQVTEAANVLRILQQDQ